MAMPFEKKKDPKKQAAGQARAAKSSRPLDDASLQEMHVEQVGSVSTAEAGGIAAVTGDAGTALSTTRARLAKRPTGAPPKDCLWDAARGSYINRTTGEMHVPGTPPARAELPCVESVASAVV